MKIQPLLRYMPVLIVLLLPVMSCRREIDLELKTNDKRLLVDAEFTNDTAIHSVKLHRTGSLLNESPMLPVSGARVSVSDGTDTIYFIENSSTPGLYQSTQECYGIGGRTYTLSILNVDPDEDGIPDEFIAHAKMPVPVVMDSLVSSRGLHPADKTAGVNNRAYFRVSYDGPDYIFKYMEVNQVAFNAINDKLGTGEIGRFESEYKISKPADPGSWNIASKYLQVPEEDITVKKGDTLTFVCLNLTNDGFQFLKEFDNNASYDWLNDFIFDQIRMPQNLPTNIEPSGKAAGFFSVMSISKISKVLNE